VLIAAGGAAKLGYAQPLSEALGYLANYVPELTGKLSEAVTYAPTTLVALGMFLAAVGFSGCCGAVSRPGRCLLPAYSAFVLGMMALQGWIVWWAETHGGSMEAGAGSLVTAVWDKQCRCLDGPACVPSATECFDPSIKIDCMCEPCKDYLLASLCSASEFATVEACSAHVESLVSSNLLFLYKVFGAVAALEVLCLVGACRISAWARSVAKEERKEERLLAETYKHSNVSFDPAA